MKFRRYPRAVLVPANSTLDVMMPREDRAFRELTIWGMPHTARTSGTRTLGALVNVTGVTVISVSQDTITGAATGTLSFWASTRTLQWQAPGSQAAGSPVSVPAGTVGSYLLTLPGGDGSYITIDVDVSAIPAVDASDVIAVSLVVAGAQVRNFSTQVFFGQTGQGAPAARANDEVYLVYDPGDAVRIWPPNEPSSNPEYSGRSNQVRGFPITVRIINNAASALGITIEFTSMSIDQG